MTTITSPRRSLLFTPANRPALFSKALVSGADMVCIDLEDAVAADQKDTSREDAVHFLLQGSNTLPERIVRINSPLSKTGQDDLERFVQDKHLSGTLLLPKVEEPDLVQDTQQKISQAGSTLKLAIMIETILGVENCFEILTHHQQLDFVMFGGADLAAELNTTVSKAPLAYGRSRLIYAARHAGIDVLDMPCLNFKDEAQVRQETSDAVLLGFTGKAAIYPANIETINSLFTPSKDEIELAERYVSAYEMSTTGVAVVDGRLVEKPLVLRMELILARARAAGIIS